MRLNRLLNKADELVPQWDYDAEYVTRWQDAIAQMAIASWNPDATVRDLIVRIGPAVLGQQFDADFHDCLVANAATWEALVVALGAADLILALGVIDQIPHHRGFLKKCARSLRPGGLLVLTATYWDCEGEDVALGHEARVRIYHRGSWKDLEHELKAVGMKPFGESDWKYPGHQLGDHTMASLVMVKS